VSKEIEEIDRQLKEDRAKGKGLSQNRNRLFNDFNLLATRNPTETNRAIFIFIVLLVLLVAGYVASFYVFA